MSMFVCSGSVVRRFKCMDASPSLTSNIATAEYCEQC